MNAVAELRRLNEALTVHSFEIDYREVEWKLSSLTPEEGAELFAMCSLDGSSTVGSSRLVGLCHLKGHGVNKDPTKAFETFSRSVEQDPIAVLNLTECYAKGIGTVKDVGRAFELVARFAESGNPVAINRLGIYSEKGIGVEKNNDLCFRYFSRSATMGDARGMAYLGTCYEEGIGVPMDMDTALYWYRRSAELGDSRGMNYLGVCHDLGTGVPQDHAVAVSWYRRSAQLGDSVSMYHLGMSYEEGTGVDGDVSVAFEWYLKSAGADDGAGMYNVGRCYDNGIGVEEDDVRAFEWYKKSAEADDSDGMWCLAEAYEWGFGTESDPAEALQWYRKSADKRDVNGMLGLANLLDGDPTQKLDALRWRSRALHQLEERLAKGQDIDEDFDLDTIRGLISSSVHRSEVLELWLRLEKEKPVWEARVRDLEAEVETLKTEIDFRPGGCGYEDARRDFVARADAGKIETSNTLSTPLSTAPDPYLCPGAMSADTKPSSGSDKEFLDDVDADVDVADVVTVVANTSAPEYKTWRSYTHSVAQKLKPWCLAEADGADGADGARVSSIAKLLLSIGGDDAELRGFLDRCLSAGTGDEPSRNPLWDIQWSQPDGTVTNTNGWPTLYEGPPFDPEDPRIEKVSRFLQMVELMGEFSSIIS